MPVRFYLCSECGRVFSLVRGHTEGVELLQCVFCGNRSLVKLPSRPDGPDIPRPVPWDPDEDEPEEVGLYAA